MRDIDYTFAVARIRSNETKLLGSADIEQLILASSYEEAVRKLSEFGYDIVDGDLGKTLNNEMDKAWQLLSESAPDENELTVLSVRNAYHNLKSALKTRVCGGKAADAFFLLPSSVDIGLIAEAVNNNDYSALPAEMTAVAEKAYVYLTDRADGQSAEALIDRQSLESFVSLGEKSGCSELFDACCMITAAADIKIAYRSAVTHRSRDFLELSVAQCPGISRDELINASLTGAKSVTAYAASTKYGELVSLLGKDAAGFEKKCDDSVMEIIKKGKYAAFGFLPLAAYYFAKETEIRCVRIVMSAKENNLSPSSIRERVRELYV